MQLCIFSGKQLTDKLWWQKGFQAKPQLGSVSELYAAQRLYAAAHAACKLLFFQFAFPSENTIEERDTVEQAGGFNLALGFSHRA